MDDRARIHHVVDELNLPKERFVLAGSGVMVLHGMDRKPRDLDIFCATATWFALFRDGRKQWNLFTTDPDDSARRCDPPYLYKEMYGIEVNIFSAWRVRDAGNIDVNFWMHNSKIVDGVPCVPLELILLWKEQVGRGKDMADISTIREFMGRAV